MPTFGKRMKVMRAVRGYSQVRLAGRAGIALSFLVSAEQGKRELAEDEMSRARCELDWPDNMDAVIDSLFLGGFVK